MFLFIPFKNIYYHFNVFAGVGDWKSYLSKCKDIVLKQHVSHLYE